MNKILAYAMVGLLLGTVFLETARAEKSEYDIGRSWYLNKCQICHGYKGDGKGPGGVYLTPQPRDFTNSRFWNDKTAETITYAVTHGLKPMPAFNLNPEDIKAIINYMSHTFKTQ